MNTDLFVDSRRRFREKQEKPEMIRSDNTKNFTSGENEIKERILLWNQKIIHKFIVQ